MTLSAVAQMRHDAVLDSGWWEDVVVRLDDANFTEDKHPRGPDGKFIKGSGTKVSTKSFMAYMKNAGKTVTKSALIKHLLSGGHHQDDVIEAVKDEFPQDSAAVDKAYVKYYHNQLAKVTPAFPPLKPGSSGEKYHGEAEPTTPEEPKPFAFPVSKPKSPPAAASEPFGAGAEKLPPANLESKQVKAIQIFYIGMTNEYGAVGKVACGLSMAAANGAQKKFDDLLAAYTPFPETGDKRAMKLNELVADLKASLAGKSASMPATAPEPSKTSGLVDPNSKRAKALSKFHVDVTKTGLGPVGAAAYDFSAAAANKNAEKLQNLADNYQPISEDIPHAAELNKLVADLKATGAPAPPPKPIPVAAQPMHKLSSDSKKFLSDQVEKYLDESKVAGTKEKYHAVIAALDTKGSVEDQQNAVGKLETFPNPSGMLQQNLNKFIEKAQLDYGVQKLQSSVPVAGPKPTPAQQQNAQDGVYHALVKAPPKKMHLVTYHYDASGNEVGAVLKADTSKIPGDHYSKVTAAYGLDPNPVSEAVGKAMQAYGYHMSEARSDAANSAIWSYQGSGYTAINQALLNPEASHSPTIKKKIRQVANSIASEYLPADTPLIRGIKCSLKDLAGFDTAAESIGRVFAHKNFCSASRSERQAKWFAGDRHRVLLHFTAPAGCNALVMASGQTGGEAEVVLPANCMFRIDKIEKSTDSSGYDVHKVHCTYLGVKENG